MLREITIAAFLGNGPALEAFTAAFRIPNTMQNLLGEGVLSASFIPSYSALIKQGKKKEAAVVASSILTLLIGVTGILVLVGIFAAEPLTNLIASGYSGARRDLTISLIRITTPGIGLLVISGWCLGILNSHKKFFLSYVAPVIWNLAQVIVVAAAAIWWFPGVATGQLTDDAIGLATTLGWATVLGAFLQLAVQIPSVLQLQKDLRIGFFTPNETVTSIIKRFLPVLGARGVVQLSAWIDLILASFLAIGAVASLRYASFLYLLPISLFGMSIAAAELPELSGTALGVIRERVVRYARRITYFVVPIAIAYATVGDVIVGMLFQRGVFTSITTMQVWLVLAAYALGLVPSSLSRLLQSALYGLEQTRIPAKSSIVRVVLSGVVGFLLMVQFDQFAIDSSLQIFQVGPIPTFEFLPETVRESSDLARLGAVGLALGAATGAWVEFAILFFALRAYVGRIHLFKQTLRPVLGGAGAAVVIGIFLKVLFGYFNWSPLVTGLVIFPLTGLSYLFVTRALDLPIIRVIRGKIDSNLTESNKIELDLFVEGNNLQLPKPPLYYQQPIINEGYRNRINRRLAGLSLEQLAIHYHLYVDAAFHTPPTKMRVFAPKSD